MSMTERVLEKHDVELPLEEFVEKSEIQTVVNLQRKIVLEENVRAELAQRFDALVRESPKDRRSEAVHDFKVEYVAMKIKLTRFILEIRQFIEENPDFSFAEFVDTFPLQDFEESEREAIYDMAVQYIETSGKLKECFETIDKETIFKFITGIPARGEIHIERKGNQLIFYARSLDYVALYLRDPEVVREISPEGLYPPKFASAILGAKGTDGFHSTAYLATPQGEPLYVQVIGIRVEVYPIYPPGIREMEAHELQHAAHFKLLEWNSMHYDARNHTEIKKSFDELCNEGLFQLRDEVIAYARLGREMTKDSVTGSGLYAYPEKERTRMLDHLKSALGKKFDDWDIPALWQERVAERFDNRAKTLLRVGKELATLMRGTEDEKRRFGSWKLAVFEIEPPETWARLSKWLADEKLIAELVKKGVARVEAPVDPDIQLSERNAL